MCVPWHTVEVKLLCNFSKIHKICNIIPNKGALLNRLSSTRSYKCNSFTDSHYTPFPPPSISLMHSKLVRKTTPVHMNENCLRWWTATHVTRISERTDFTPNKTKEVSLQNLSTSAAEFTAKNLQSDYIGFHRLHFILIPLTLNPKILKFSHRHLENFGPAMRQLLSKSI